jgi:dipeptidyl aminopeptidase/acylaminoacyl peptidase
MVRGMLPSDIGRLVSVGDPRLSFDGSRIAYVVTSTDLDANEYRSRIWLSSADEPRGAAPLTAGLQRDRLPRWSPDGSALAFVSHRDGAPPGSELYVLRVDGGEPARIVAWPEEIDDLAWSSDGRWLAFGARRRDEARYLPDKDRDRPARHVTRLTYRLDNVGWTCDRPRALFVVPAHGTAPPRLVASDDNNEESYSGLAWSPDGRWLAFSAARTSDWDLDRFADLFIVAAHDDDGEPIRLTRGLDQGGVAFTQPSWSPDGTSIAFVLRHLRRFPFVSPIGVVRVDASGSASEPRSLTTELDRSCVPYLLNAREPVWDNDHLWFQVVDGMSVSLWRVDARSTDAKPELVLGGDQAITGFDTADGTVAYCASTPTMPSELFVTNRDGAAQHRVSFVSEPFTASRTLASPERFVAQSSDGVEVEARIMRPIGFEPGQRYPALLNIHGGPFAAYSAGFFDEFQYQAGAGYAVMFSNPRGSDGYGQSWGDAIRGPKCADEPGSGWGGIDHDDVMAVVDEALRRFEFIDPDRLGILGGSYGGFLTSWIVGHTDRFAAACSERAVNNQLTMVSTSDIGYWFQGDYVGVSHLEEPDEYLRMSPITYVANIHTPLLILHSDGDLRCPVEQAEQLFVALRMLGREVEFVRFPGEGHEMSRSGAPKHRVERGDIILEFFNRHLRPQNPAHGTTR